MTSSGKTAVVYIVWLLATGCTKENPIYCDEATRCPDELACTVERVCSAGFTISDDSLFDDGTRFWASSRQPVLQGTTDDPRATIEATLQGQTIATAVLDGANWQLTLPTDSLADPGDTTILFVQKSSNGSVILPRIFAVDAEAPTAMIAATTVLDESHDLVTSAGSGEPSHVHQSFPIVLDATHCAAVVKYSYLYDLTAPPFGSEDQPNRVFWQTDIDEEVALSATESRYRIVAADNSAVVDWTPIGELAHNGRSYTFKTQIHRGLAAGLATGTGSYTIEWEFVDWAHRKSAPLHGCWSQTLLPPPITVTPAVLSTLGPTGVGGWVLNAATPPPVAAWINGGIAGNLMESRITNTTAEEIDIELSANASLNQLTKTTTSQVSNVTTATVNITCQQLNGILSTEPECTPTDSQLGTKTTVASFAPAMSMQVGLFDDSGTAVGNCAVTSNPAVSRCRLPGRAVGGAPVSLRAVASMKPGPSELAPGTGVVADQMFQGFRYSGTAPQNRISCFHSHSIGNAQVGFGSVCDTQTRWVAFDYLQRAVLGLGNPGFISGDVRPAKLNFGTAVRDGVVITGYQAAGRIGWDSGPRQ
jgi:hypothetical protein